MFLGQLGSEFQVVGPAYANAGPPYVAKLIRGYSISSRAAEPRCRRPGTLDTGRLSE